MLMQIKISLKKMFCSSNLEKSQSHINITRPENNSETHSTLARKGYAEMHADALCITM